MVVLSPERSPSQGRKVVARTAPTGPQLNWRLILALSLNLIAWAGLIALVLSFL
jgi:hypothetical protein